MFKSSVVITNLKTKTFSTTASNKTSNRT